MRLHTATHCTTWQHTATHTATHCNSRRHTATRLTRDSFARDSLDSIATWYEATHCNILQHTETHGITLQHIATQVTCDSFARDDIAMAVAAGKHGQQIERLLAMLACSNRHCYVISCLQQPTRTCRNLRPTDKHGQQSLNLSLLHHQRRHLRSLLRCSSPTTLFK